MTGPGRNRASSTRGEPVPALARYQSRRQAGWFSDGAVPVRRRGKEKDTTMKGIIAWLLGVPIVVIVLFYVTGIF